MGFPRGAAGWLAGLVVEGKRLAIDVPRSRAAAGNVEEAVDGEVEVCSCRPAEIRLRTIYCFCWRFAGRAVVWGEVKVVRVEEPFQVRRGIRERGTSATDF